MIAPALLATQWFENEKRVLAITIGANAKTVGMALGSVFPTIFVETPSKSDETIQNEIFISLVVQASIVGVIMLLALFTFQNKPKAPPSSNATVDRSETWFRTYIKAFKNYEFFKL